MRPALQGRYVREGLFEFNPQRHDWGTKTLLGAPLRAEGLAEVDEALDRLARAPATARFVTHKMAVFMVGDKPSPALLQQLAQTFERTEGDIAAVLQVLFETPEFEASLGQRFRDHVHYVLAGLRLAHGDAVVPSAAPALGWLQRLAEPLYGRATPDGYPLDAAPWSGSGQMNTRFEIARAMGAGAGARDVSGTSGRAAQTGEMGQMGQMGKVIEENNTPASTRASSPSSQSPAGSSPMPAKPSTSPVKPPALAQTDYARALLPTWSAATRDALAQATSPRDWNLLFLASPEFMHG